MDRYEKRANQRDDMIYNAYRKSGQPPTYFENPDVVDWMEVTDILRAASTTYTPPGQEKDDGVT